MIVISLKESEAQKLLKMLADKPELSRVQELLKKELGATVLLRNLPVMNERELTLEVEAIWQTLEK